MLIIFPLALDNINQSTFSMYKIGHSTDITLLKPKSVAITVANSLVNNRIHFSRADMTKMCVGYKIVIILFVV